MALTLSYTREPTVAGDFAIWGNYLMAQVRRGGEGALSCELYNNSGSLYLSRGHIGINNGSGRGSIECTEAGSINTGGLTANCWAAIEVSVSGVVATLSITSIAGELDESFIPTSIKGSYNYEKQGYYLTATKRLIGIVFLRTALSTGRIVNCEGGKFGFKNIRIVEKHDASGALSLTYLDSVVQAIGDWNMDTSEEKTVTFPYVSLDAANNFAQRIKNVFASIYYDSDTAVYTTHTIAQYINLADPFLSNGGIRYVAVGGAPPYTLTVVLHRRTGGAFDSASYDQTSYNRGWITVEFET